MRWRAALGLGLALTGAAQAEDIVEGQYDCASGVTLPRVFLPIEETGDFYVILFVEGRLLVFYPQGATPDGTSLFTHYVGDAQEYLYFEGPDGQTRLVFQDGDEARVIAEECRFSIY
jgi:hypothetical protein